MHTQAIADFFHSSLDFVSPDASIPLLPKTHPSDSLVISGRSTSDLTPEAKNALAESVDSSSHQSGATEDAFVLLETRTKSEKQTFQSRKTLEKFA
jgi:hypothetical protein